MEQALRTQIILAAVSAAGPADAPGWADRVEELACGITALTTSKVGPSAVIDRMTASDTKVFRGSVVQVVKEKSSTRGVITLFTGTDREFKDGITKQPLTQGCEQVRTDRTDQSDKPGRRLAKRAQSLIGHEVVVYVAMDPMDNGSGQKVRVLVHIEDLGLSDQPMARNALKAWQAERARRQGA